MVRGDSQGWRSSIVLRKEQFDECLRSELHRENAELMSKLLSHEDENMQLKQVQRLDSTLD